MPLQGVNPGNAESLVLNPAFSGLVESLLPSDLGLGAHNLFPEIRFQSNGNGMGYFVRFNLSENLRYVEDEVLVRRYGSAAQKVNRERRLETFQVTRRHLDAAVPKEMADLIRQQTRGADDPAVSEVTWVRELMLLNKEKRAADTAARSTSVGAEVTPAAPWDNYATSDPIADINNARLLVRANSGLWPTDLALTYKVAIRLASHPKIRGMRAYTERTRIDADELASLLQDVFNFKRVHILRSMYNTNRPDRNASLNLNEVWGPHVYLFYRPDDPSLTKLMWGADLVDTYYYDGMGAGVFPWFDPDTETTYYRVREDSDIVVLNPELAVAIRNVITS